MILVPVAGLVVVPVDPVPTERVRRAASWAGLDLGPGQEAALAGFTGWLRDEALPAGGVGPDEGGRIVPRHVADSLLFAGVWWGDRPPRTLLDVGSGVGLPGLPLAIAWPETAVTLLDRAERRTRLARRAVRVLALDNVTVVTSPLRRHRERYDLVVMRAVFPLPEAVAAVLPVLGAPGTAGLALSRQEAPPLPAEPPGWRFQVVAVPPTVLDSPAWILRMAAIE